MPRGSLGGEGEGETEWDKRWVFHIQERRFRQSEQVQRNLQKQWRWANTAMKGERAGHMNTTRWSTVAHFYLHHQLLPCQWLTVGGVGRQVGTLELQGDVATLLLQRSGQLLEARLLLLHRGQDAGSRANVVVIHGRRWLGLDRSSKSGMEGKEGGRGGDQVIKDTQTQKGWMNKFCMKQNICFQSRTSTCDDLAFRIISI